MATDTIEKAQPKLAPDARYFPLKDGVLFKNFQGSFALKGKGLFSLVDQLSQRLDGKTPFLELLSELPDPVANISKDAMQLLIQRRIFRNHSVEDPHTLTPDELTHFQDTIEFLQQFMDDAHLKFQMFRKCPVLVLGPIAFQTALVEWLCRSGSEHILSPETDSWPIDAMNLDSTTDGFHRFEQVSIEEGFKYAGLALVGFQGADFAGWRHLRTLAQESGTLFLGSMLTSNELILGPLIKPTFDMSADLYPQRIDKRETPLDPGNESEPKGGTEWKLLAHMVGFEALKMLTGCLKPETDEGVLFVSLPDMRTHRSPWVMADQAREMVSKDTKFSQWSESEPAVLSSRDLLASVTQLMDPKIGFFAPFEDMDLIQLPIKRSQITLRPDHGFHNATFYGVSHESLLEARADGLKKALGHWGLINPNSGISEQFSPTALMEEFSTTSCGFGVGVCTHYPNALDQALLAAYGSFLTKTENRDFRRTQQVIIPPSSSILTNNRHFKYLMKTVQRFGCDVRMFQISNTGSASVCIGNLIKPEHHFSRPWLIGLGKTTIQAMINVLLEAISLVQADYHGEPTPASLCPFQMELDQTFQGEEDLLLKEEHSQSSITLLEELTSLGLEITPFYTTPNELEQCTKLRSLLIKLSRP